MACQRCGIGGHRVLEYATTYRHDMLSLDVSVRTLAGLNGEHFEAVFLRTGQLGMPFQTSPCHWPSLVSMQRLASDGTEELRIRECVSIADRHELTAEVALARYHTIFLPELSKGPVGVGRSCRPPLQYQVDDERAHS